MLCLITAVPVPKDMLHTVHQGVALYSIAGLVTHHYEENFPDLTLSQLNAKLADEAWSHYRQWCKGRSVVCPTSSSFTALRFGRKSWQSFSELASCYKGAMVKYMIFWAADFLKAKLKEKNSENNRTRSYCAWALARFQFLQETNGPWLSVDAANEMCLQGRSFLLFYQKLAVQSRAQCPGRKMYKVVPKFHSLLHLCLFVKATRRNPRYDHLYQEEDFMKHVGKICSKCHPSTLNMVSLFRYRALKELVWKNLGFPTLGAKLGRMGQCTRDQKKQHELFQLLFVFTVPSVWLHWRFQKKGWSEPWFSNMNMWDVGFSNTVWAWGWHGRTSFWDFHISPQKNNKKWHHQFCSVDLCWWHLRLFFLVYIFMYIWLTNIPWYTI